MTRAFIWDLDGTLLDSYEAILDGIAETYAHYSLDFDREAVHAFILQQSVQALLEEVAREHGLDAEEMNRYRASRLREKNAQVHLMSGARDILSRDLILFPRGCHNGQWLSKKTRSRRSRLSSG